MLMALSLILYFSPTDSAWLAHISSWMAAYQLKLNSCKTELLYIPEDAPVRLDLPGHLLDLTICH